VPITEKEACDRAKRFDFLRKKTMIGTHMGRKEIRSYLMPKNFLLLGFILAGIMLASHLQAQFILQEIMDGSPPR
jgi:hypothetical protein